MTIAVPSPNDLYHAAQGLIREGQPVFPCRPAGEKAKAPLTRNGLKDATTDRAAVKRWWQRQGDAAIGIPTGIIYDVLDVDVKNAVDGRVHLPFLQRIGLLNGCVKVAKTPSGGWHLYFPAARGLTNRASATLGLDVRALGGYVIAAPSFIETQGYSGTYADLGPTTGSDGSHLMWDLIVSALSPINKENNKAVQLLPSERRASVAALREWMSQRAAGERNNALHWAVCRCIDNGIDPHEMAEPALLAGLGEAETMLTINSALKRAGLTAEELDSEAEALFPQPV